MDVSIDQSHPLRAFGASGARPAPANPTARRMTGRLQWTRFLSLAHELEVPATPPDVSGFVPRHVGPRAVIWWLVPTAASPGPMRS